MPRFTLDLTISEASDLVAVLEQAREQAHAWMKAKHSTDEERKDSERRYINVQTAIDQLKKA